MHGDIRTISSIKGIGKKTAERIVLELKNKFEDLPLLNTINGVTATAQSSITDEAVLLLVNTQPCPWQNIWYTRGTSNPVLSY